MGRLPLVIISILALSACDKGDAAGPAAGAAVGRSEAVVATGAPATATTTAPAPHPTAPAGPRKLCEGDSGAGRTLPKVSLTKVAASGATPLDSDRIPAGDGKSWTWINFFAAWCGPCKEEMPRLKGFEKKLAAQGTPVHLAFVSIDDDERQLGKFLDAQPADGVKAALWLKNGRDGWLSSMKLKNPPDLPEHALIDPSGKVRCIVEGAVEDADLPQLATLFSRK